MEVLASTTNFSRRMRRHFSVVSGCGFKFNSNHTACRNKQFKGFVSAGFFTVTKPKEKVRAARAQYCRLLTTDNETAEEGGEHSTLNIQHQTPKQRRRKSENPNVTNP